MKQLDSYTIVKSIQKDPYLYLYLLVINIFSFGYIIGFGGYFFRDFSIIFDGGLRIWHGQMPYRDFFISTGPMVYYIQGLFEWIFGPNTLSMKMHAAVLNSIVISIFFVYARNYIDNILAFGMTLLLHFFFYGRLVNPWYDQTALFFYFIAQIIVLNNIEEEIQWWKLSTVGILIGLSIFSKQDVGGLAFLFVAGQLLLFSIKNIKYTFIYIFSFTCLIIVTVAYFTSISEFGYWFNYGQDPHSSRLSGAILRSLTDLKLLGDFRLYAFIFSIGFILLIRDLSYKSFFNLFMISGFVIFSIIFKETSGQGKYSSLFFMPFIALFITRLITQTKKIEFNKLTRKLAVYLIGWVFIAYTLELAFWNTFVFKEAIKKNKYVTLENSSFSGYRFEKEIVEGIEQIKHELQKGKINNDKDWFLNMSSYTFLYKDLNIEPPRGMHLYYHRNVTLFDKDYTEFKKKLKENHFQYILLQELASGTPPLEFREFISSIGYEKILSVDTPKSGVSSSGRGDRYNATLYKLIIK